MKKGYIFWGVLLLTLGVLFILRNLGIFYFNFHSFLRLWPLIFVFWGIAILPVKSFIKLILTGITILLAILIMARHNGNDDHWSWWEFEDFTYGYDNRDYEYEDYPNEEQDMSETYDSAIMNARLNLNAAAGKFYIKNQATGLFEMNTEGNVGPYEVKTTISDSSATINVKHKKNYRHKGK